MQSEKEESTVGVASAPAMDGDCPDEEHGAPLTPSTQPTTEGSPVSDTSKMAMTIKSAFVPVVSVATDSPVSESVPSTPSKAHVGRKSARPSTPETEPCSPSGRSNRPPVDMDTKDSGSEGSITTTDSRKQAGDAQNSSASTRSTSRRRVTLPLFKALSPSGTIHRVHCEPRIFNLMESVALALNEDPESLKLSYVDSEGDTMIVSCDNEVMQALREAAKSGKKAPKLQVEVSKSYSRTLWRTMGRGMTRLSSTSHDAVDQFYSMVRTTRTTLVLGFSKTAQALPKPDVRKIVESVSMPTVSVPTVSMPTDLTKWSVQERALSLVSHSSQVIWNMLYLR